MPKVHFLKGVASWFQTFLLGLLTDPGKVLTLMTSSAGPLVPSVSLTQLTSGWFLHLLLVSGHSEKLLETSFLQTGLSLVALIS